MRTRLLLTFAIVGLLNLTSTVRRAHADLVFGTPTLVPYPIYSGHKVLSPSLSSDDLEMYIESTQPGSGDDDATWMATRATTHDAWGVPQPVTSIDYPSISADGLSLYGNEIGPFGQSDIYVMTRPSTDAAWGPPQVLDGNVNSQWRERYAEISSDGLELYISRGNYPIEIWVSQRADTNQPFGPAVRLPDSINDGSAMAPTLTDDGLYLIFPSSREGGFGGFDLWATFRPTKDSPWGEPFNLGPEYNTPLGEWGPDISAGKKTLYFSRSEPDLTGDHDLWMTLPLSPGEPSLDVDANGEADALTDGILILRYLFGFTGEAMVEDALAPNANRTDPAEIAAFLDSFAPSTLAAASEAAWGPLVPPANNAVFSGLESKSAGAVAAVPEPSGFTLCLAAIFGYAIYAICRYGFRVTRLRQSPSATIRSEQ